MAEYSKEYVNLNKLKTNWDFSIEEAFKCLKDGQDKKIICEGFGITKIINKDGECYVVINGEHKLFKDIYLEENDSFWSFNVLFLVVVLAIIFFWSIIIITIPSSGDRLTRGEFGDMFGGVNALFSGLAFAGIIITISLQRKELSLQREELKKTREEFEIQNETMKLQKFENTFFHLLNNHKQIIESLTAKKELKGNLALEHELRLFVDNTKLHSEIYISKIIKIGVSDDIFPSKIIESIKDLNYINKDIMLIVKYIQSANIIDKQIYFDLLYNSMSKTERLHFGFFISHTAYDIILEENLFKFFIEDFSAHTNGLVKLYDISIPRIGISHHYYKFKFDDFINQNENIGLSIISNEEKGVIINSISIKSEIDLIENIPVNTKIEKGETYIQRNLFSKIEINNEYFEKISKEAQKLFFEINISYNNQTFIIKNSWSIRCLSDTIHSSYIKYAKIEISSSY